MWRQSKSSNERLSTNKTCYIASTYWITRHVASPPHTCNVAPPFWLFTNKSFVNALLFMKFTKVFSRESFPLCRIKIDLHTATKEIGLPLLANVDTINETLNPLGHKWAILSWKYRDRCLEDIEDEDVTWFGNNTLNSVQSLPIHHFLYKSQ